ncbi:MAG: glycosyltransferase [Pleurocapsa sp. MO_192.B19]|nr:glycosyltransferase [Pleurocapsa sp. MO_192.B19]
MNRAIAFFIPAMYGGGAERVVLNLLEGMTAKDLPLDLVLASAEGPYFDRVPQTVNIVDLKAGRIIKSILPLVRYLRTNRPRVLISHLGHANVIALVANYLSGTNTPIVVVQHNTLSAARSTLWRANLIKPMMKWLYRHADAVVTVSQAAARDLEIGLGLAEKSVQTIYNPIVDRRLLAQANEPLNEPWLQPGSPPVFLSIGRLTAQKDFATLLRGFATVNQQLDARLIILGEGELRQELEALAQNLGIAESVSLPGFVNNPYPYFKAASAFVLSSRWEGLPTVLIEALACGCPVVATDCPSGPLEILAQGKYGHLVPIGDSAALAAAMIQVLDKSPETEFLVKRSQDFAVERSVTEYLQLIEKVCS